MAEENQPDSSEVEAMLALVSRLAAIHQRLRGEQRWCATIGEEELAKVLGVALLPLEAAIVDAGRAARGLPPLVASSA